MQLRNPGVIRILTAKLLIAGAFTIMAADRQKTDKILLKNGDQITCEIIKLERNQLTIKTAYSKGSFIIDWHQIKQIVSDQGFVVETSAGDFVSGSLKTDPDDEHKINVSQTPFPQQEIISVRQVERGILNRSALTIDYGLSFTRSNSQSQSNLAATYRYFSGDIMLNTTINSLYASQQNAANTSRQQSDSTFYRRLHNHSESYGMIFAGFLSNNAQSLDLRVTSGAGLAHRFLSSNRTLLTGVAGLVYTNEKFSPTGETPGRFSSIETMIGGEYRLFSFDSTELTSTISIYPSLTEAGRVRANGNVDLYLDLVGDFYWRIGVFNNYDSRPPLNTLRNDFGVTTSIGWKF